MSGDLPVHARSKNQDLLRTYMSGKPEDQFISGAETWLAHSKELATLTLYERRINRVLTRNKVDSSPGKPPVVAQSSQTARSRLRNANRPRLRPPANRLNPSLQDSPMASFIRALILRRLSTLSRQRRNSRPRP
jgi:hypothetical protein